MEDRDRTSQEARPNYGVIDHYLGEEGDAYFEWQGENGIQKALFQKHLWEPHVGAQDDVLDFGCGGGFLLKVLEAERKTGVEINPHAIRCARKQGIEVHPTVHEVEGTFTKVISSHALEHIPHPRQAILELKEKLRNADSRLLLLLPLDDWRSPLNRQYHPADVNMHLHTWTPQLIGNLLKSCGLQVHDVHVITHAWPPYNLKYILWNWSRPFFHVAAYFWSVRMKQRQLFAVAGLPKAGEERQAR